MVDKNGNSGIYCPACDKRLGLSDSKPQLVRAMHQRIEKMVVKCPLCGAAYDYERLLSLRPRMVQTRITERQPPNTLPLTIWVYPEPLEALRQRFPQNLMTTLTAWFTAVADPDTVMIEGEHGRALKQSGVLRGRDVEGLGPYIKQLEQDVEDAKIRERALGPLLAMMQMLGQGAGVGAGADRQERREQTDHSSCPPRLPASKPRLRQTTSPPTMLKSQTRSPPPPPRSIHLQGRCFLLSLSSQLSRARVLPPLLSLSRRYSTACRGRFREGGSLHDNYECCASRRIPDISPCGIYGDCRARPGRQL